MVKKLKLEMYYLSQAGRGFAQIMATDVLRLVPDGLKSKKAAPFLLFKVCPTSIFLELIMPLFGSGSSGLGE